MKRILIGQILLILCCVFYLVWWYRGYRPGAAVQRAGGINGILLLITAAFGVAGLLCSLKQISGAAEPRISPGVIAAGGIVVYAVLLIVTQFVFHRIVTAELFLIVGWTVLEMTVISRLDAAGMLPGNGFRILCLVIAAAFAVSLVLYVAYYRMEEMKAFYAAMVPLITEAASMAILIGVVCQKNGIG